jgi:hypothetical protein
MSGWKRHGGEPDVNVPAEIGREAEGCVRTIWIVEEDELIDVRDEHQWFSIQAVSLAIRQRSTDGGKGALLARRGLAPGRG